MDPPMDRLPPNAGPPPENLGLAPEPEPDSEGTPIIVRIGSVVAAGVLAAIVSSLPGALRMGDESSIGNALERWLVLTALATPVAVAGVAVIRRARVGLQLLLGERAPLFAMGVLWWSVIELALFGVFGAVLRKTTHHHALAGVTFAAFAVISGAVVALLARRVMAILARGGTSLQRVALAIAGGAVFIALLLVGVRTSRAVGLHTASALVDWLAFAVTVAIASARILTRARPLAIAGVPVAVLVIMVGFTTLRFDPSLRASLASTAPMHAFVLDFFGR